MENTKSDSGSYVLSLNVLNCNFTEYKKVFKVLVLKLISGVRGTSPKLSPSIIPKGVKL